MISFWQLKDPVPLCGEYFRVLKLGQLFSLPRPLSARAVFLVSSHFRVAGEVQGDSRSVLNVNRNFKF
jgi:hypothetical protein